MEIKKKEAKYVYKRVGNSEFFDFERYYNKLRSMYLWEGNLYDWTDNLKELNEE